LLKNVRFHMNEKCRVLEEEEEDVCNSLDQVLTPSHLVKKCPRLLYYFLMYSSLIVN
jgi:hypothetical protein